MNANMEDAPKDCRILILTEVHHWVVPTKYIRGVGTRRLTYMAGWQKVGERWVECFWYVPTHEDGQGPRWMTWAGSPTSISSETIYPVAWAEVPS